MSEKVADAFDYAAVIADEHQGFSLGESLEGSLEFQDGYGAKIAHAVKGKTQHRNLLFHGRFSVTERKKERNR